MKFFRRKPLLISLMFFSLFIAAFVLRSGGHVYADPDWNYYCNQPGGKTIHALYPNPSDVSSSDRTAPTTLYAQSHICYNAPYSFAGGIIIHFTGVETIQGTGAFNTQVPRDFGMGSLSGRDVSTPAQTQPVNMTNLSDGLNCWRLHFYAQADYNGDGRYTGSGETSGDGWWDVCVNYTFVPRPTSTIRGHIYKVDGGGNYLGGVAGATVATCTNANLITDGNGFFNWPGITQGDGFCLRTGGAPAGFDGPFVRPWSENYSSCPGFVGPPYSGHCASPTYECQIAGGLFDYGCHLDRNWDEGYDFVYVQRATIQGHIFKVDRSGNRLGDVVGATVATCTNTNLVTDGNGFFTWSGITPGTGFCLRTGGAPAGFDGPFVRPWGPGYSSCSGYGGPPYTGYCNYPGGWPTYECQIAGGLFDYGCHLDRNADGGYDFVYVQQPPDNPPNINLNVNCDTASGTASDPDNSGAQLTVQLYVNGTLESTQRTSGTSHSFNFVNALSKYKGFSSNNVQLKALGVKYDGSRGQDASVIKPTGVCARATCGSATMDPSLPEPGTQFRVRVNVNYGNKGAQGANPSRPGYKMSITIAPNPSYNNTDIPYDQTSGLSDWTPYFTAPPAGTFTITWRFSGTGVDSGSCSQTASSATKPYFRTYGGDTIALKPGACTTKGWGAGIGLGGIYGFNDRTGKGAAAQLAAMAFGKIEEFTSATGRSSSPAPPGGLAFAGTTALGSVYGGNFNANPCPPNYFGPANALAAGNATIGAASYVAGSAPAIVYVHGNVRITGNITYSTASWQVGKIPSFTLVSTGDIYIDPGVTELDGLYVAKGTIYTCSDPNNLGGFTKADNSHIAGNSGPNLCNQRLRVYGSFVANSIKLLRNIGSVKDSNPSEQYSSSNAAEIFIFTPEQWLTKSAVPPSGGSGDYDSITSLPPVL